MSELAARHLVHRRRRATVAGRPHARAGGGAGGGAGRTRGALRVAARGAGRADIVISGTGAPGLVIRREDVEVARARRAARGRCSSSTSRCRATSSPRCAKLRGRLPLRPRRPALGGGRQPARAPQAGGGRRGPGRARGARVPGLAEVAATWCRCWSSCASAGDEIRKSELGEGALAPRARSRPSRRRRSRRPPPPSSTSCSTRPRCTEGSRPGTATSGEHSEPHPEAPGRC